MRAASYRCALVAHGVRTRRAHITTGIEGSCAHPTHTLKRPSSTPRAHGLAGIEPAGRNPCAHGGARTCRPSTRAVRAGGRPPCARVVHGGSHRPCGTSERRFGVLSSDAIQQLAIQRRKISSDAISAATQFSRKFSSDANSAVGHSATQIQQRRKFSS
ncbi:hypothetical protein F511_15736 [Dorcoceras hygrometricum]|uniref:Uncharacterized protein n=1 Tax=Dorcoceras hygrometricum TaxID=472368 RepID=A0A2Z7D9V2_9LAMI|nr:hypothetical protein F511_15736 [Dorcoceras hygrometricum]